MDFTTLLKILLEKTMFQHTGRHIKHRPMCCPETEGVTPLLSGLSALKGGVSTSKDIKMKLEYTPKPVYG